jgi:hypothetical protein
MTAIHKRKVIQGDAEDNICRSCYEFIPTRRDKDEIITPEDIAIAKIDGICPRCDRPIEFFNGDALCVCGFSV